MRRVAVTVAVWILASLGLGGDLGANGAVDGSTADMMISPRLVPSVGLFDFHRAEEMIECGFAAAKREVDNIKRELATRRFKTIYARAG